MLWEAIKKLVFLTDIFSLGGALKPFPYFAKMYKNKCETRDFVEKNLHLDFLFLFNYLFVGTEARGQPRKAGTYGYQEK